MKKGLFISSIVLISTTFTGYIFAQNAKGYEGADVTTVTKCLGTAPKLYQKPDKKTPVDAVGIMSKVSGGGMDILEYPPTLGGTPTPGKCYVEEKAHFQPENKTCCTKWVKKNGQIVCGSKDGKEIKLTKKVSDHIDFVGDKSSCGGNKKEDDLFKNLEKHLLPDDKQAPTPTSPTPDPDNLLPKDLTNAEKQELGNLNQNAQAREEAEFNNDKAPNALPINQPRIVPFFCNAHPKYPSCQTQ